MTRSKAGLGLAILCLLWALAGCQAETGWHWERVEAGLPRQVVVLALAADPTDPRRLWAGYYAAGGLATSHDGGQSWITDTQGLGDNPVFDLLLSTGNVIWAATRDGLVKSTDGGASWKPVTAPALRGVTAFTLESDASGRVYAGLDEAGLLVGTPDGEAWKPLSDEERLSTAAVLSLAVSADGKHLYAGTAARGLFASRDAGQTWTAAFEGDYVPNLALNPYRPATAIASLRNRLVRTRDGGQTWETLDVPWAGDEVVSLLWLADAAHQPPSEGNREGLWLAGSGQGQVYCSQDEGETWTAAGARIPAQGGVLALAATGDRILAGTWTGIYARPIVTGIGSQGRRATCGNEGETWTYLSPALGMPHANALLAAEAGLLIGTRAGLFRWEPAARQWARVDLNYSADQDSPPGGVAALAASPSDGQVVYAGAAGGGLLRSNDGGRTWARVPSDLETGIHRLAVAPEDSDHVYMLAAWERVYESHDGGHNWQARWTGLDVTREATGLAIDPLDPATVYLGTDGGLYRSRYGGQDWRTVGHRLDGQTILTLLARADSRAREGQSTLYIGATRGAYRSRDAGQTIESWGQGLEGVSVTAILFDPGQAERVYAGTAYAGLYQSFDGGETWQPTGPPELAEDMVEAMAWGPAGELFVATASSVWMGRRE